MDTRKPFDVAAGLAVQRAYLNRWESILVPAKFRRLIKWITIQNKKVQLSTGATGYNVTRGTDIDNWIHNNLMVNKPESKLPAEFVELNNQVIALCLSGKFKKIIGEDRYLLLQGSKVKGYSLSIFKGERGSGSFIHTLINGNKKTIEETIWLLNGLKLASQK